MGLPGASGMSPPSIGAHWGSTSSFGAGARAGPASEGGVRCEDSPRSGPVGDPRRSVEILGAAKAPSVCAKTGWIQTSAEATTLIATSDAHRVKLRERPLATNGVVFIFLGTNKAT